MRKKRLDKALLLILVTIWFLPIVTMVITSFSNRWVYPDIVPKAVNTDAWRYVLLENMDTYTSLQLTICIALCTILINIVIGIPAADALGRYQFKGKTMAEILISLPIVLPPIAIMLGLHRTFLRLGLTESIFGVVLANVIPTLPYMVRSLSIGFESMGFHFEEQAQMLGATKLQRLFYIIIPSLIPSLVAGSSLCILISASQYLSVLIIGGGLIKTVPVIMFPFLSGGNQAIGSAYGFLFSTMALVLLIIMDIVVRGFYKHMNYNGLRK